MDPIIPTSFIPKRPVMSSEENFSAPRRPFGLLSMVATTIFLAAIVAEGGIFFIERQLVNQKDSLERKIVEARRTVDPNSIERLKRLDNRISAIKDLLRNHIVITPIFQALQESTIRSVQFKKFSYSFDPGRGGFVAVEMHGTAKNYETIALQSDAFGESDIIRDAVFSNLIVDEKKALISFRLRFNVPADALSYQAFVDRLGGVSGALR